jgi:predicted branched-subunit amino acid permease
LAGVRAALPYVAGYLPFALAIGALARQTTFSPLAGWSSSWLIYGATAQVVAMEQLDAGASIAVVVASSAIINLRLLAYAGALAPRWQGARTRWTAVASAVLVDPAYVIAHDRWTRDGGTGTADTVWHRHFYLGAAGALWITWVAETGIGTLLGPRLAAVLPGEALAPLMLAVMLGLLARDATSRWVAAAGLVLGVPAMAIPEGAGPVVAAVAAVAAIALVRRVGR